MPRFEGNLATGVGFGNPVPIVAKGCRSDVGVAVGVSRCLSPNVAV